MKIGIAQQINGNLQIVDEDDEDAPLITVEFHNEAARIPWEQKVELVRLMLEEQEPKVWWPIALVWGTLGGALGYILACVVAFVRAM